jgi:hypothetical protein
MIDMQLLVPLFRHPDDRPWTYPAILNLTGFPCGSSRGAASCDPVCPDRFARMDTEWPTFPKISPHRILQAASSSGCWMIGAHHGTATISIPSRRQSSPAFDLLVEALPARHTQAGWRIGGGEKDRRVGVVRTELVDAMPRG